MTGVFVTGSEAETAAIGRALAADLSRGTVVLLSGDLGAGKTAFVRGIAAGLGIDPDEVSSPTFTLIQEYRGTGLTLFHVDLYRLRPREAEDLGLEEIVPRGVTAIEWPDRLAQPFTPAVAVSIAHGADERRTIRIEVSSTNPPPNTFA